MATSKQIVDQIRPGDTVTFRDRFGKARKGKAVMYGPSGWVLNIGGKYGIPLPVKESQIEKVVRSRSAASGYASRVLGKQNPYKHPGAVSFESLGIGERFKFAPWGPGPIDRTSHTVYTKTSGRRYTDGKYSFRVGSVKATVERYGKQNPAGYIDSFGRFRPIRSGTRYGNYKGKRMQWQDATPYDDAKATGGYKSSWAAKLKAATKKAKKGKGRKKNPESRYELQRLSSGRWKYETGGDKLNSLAQEAQNVTSRYRIVDTDTGNKWSVTVLRTGSNRVSKLS